MNSMQDFTAQFFGQFGSRVRSMFNAFWDAGIIRFRDNAQANLLNLDINNGRVSAFGATPVARPSAYTQTYSTADKTLDAALTDSTTGTAGTTLAAGAGIFTLSIPIQLAAMTMNAADLVTAYVLGFKFKILAWSFITTTIGAGTGASQVLNMEIGTTDVGTTPSTCTITLAGTDTLGKKTDGTTVTGANTGSATDTFSVEVAAGGTVFTAGNGILLIQIQNMDIADAIASLASSLLDLKQFSNSIVDDLQAEGWLQ